MRKTILTTLVLAILSYGVVSAGGPVFWRVNTRADVERGDSRGVTIADNGMISLAPSLKEVFDTKQAYIWSTVGDEKGNVYLGTGNEGRVFKVAPDGKGSLLFKSSELSVMALALDDKGNVYAGTSPDGKVYRITPSGEAKVFFEPKSKYIWSLAFDSKGHLLVGTGDKGIIYRVNSDGVGAPFVKTTQTNITVLRTDAAGNVIVGTDPGGLLLRITPEGKAFTLFDSAQKEVRDIAISKNGDIYVLALSDSAAGGGGNAASPSSLTAMNAPMPMDDGVTVTISDLTIVDAGNVSSSSMSSSGGGQTKSALYKIDSSGVGSTIWDSKDATAFALSLENDGRLLVGTGLKGRIFSVKSSENPSLLAQSPEGQTSNFLRIGNTVYAATSNLGKLFKLEAEASGTGSYTSYVRDAQTASTWGRISWTGEGSIELQTRSGNTSAPDSTWSDWSKPIANVDGDPITSPSARYIQWRATLKRAGNVSPRLREVAVSYLPRNSAPRISSLNVLPLGTSLQPPLVPPQNEGGGDPFGNDDSNISSSMQMPPRRIFQRGAVAIQWKAEDANGDNLEYSVYYKSVFADDFFLLKSGLKDNYFTVEPNALPDGKYVFRVVATDAISNPAGLNLSDEKETEPVDIDNSPPSVTFDAPRITGNSVDLIFHASDNVSMIRRAEYQIDGGQWKTVFPVDGIADSKREDFRVSIQLPDAKNHVIALRAFDSGANIGSTQSVVKAK